MAGPTAASRAEPAKGAPRTSSMDSAISAATKTSTQKGPRELETDSQDIASLIKTAGSPEAVIQYLLKEKQSQAQQNSQLWRLVDKQRAMILGLNKDLERSLKDKEKYRKKLKEVMSVPEIAKSAGLKKTGSVPDVVLGRSVPKVDVHGPTDQQVVAPDSPSLDSDSQKHSPIDLAMAPYPITPPADQPNNGPPSAVGELLDPSHSMPKPQEHAYDRYDHEAEEKAEQAARQQDEERQLQELPINVSLPPSRSLPSKPPKMPPPKPPMGPPSPVTATHGSPQVDEGLAQFPAPPPRKAPPAPLQLYKEKSLILDEDETDSDFDDILQVDKVIDPKRGRRRTREEDDRMREILAQQEAERRSLSKKSKQSQKSTPTDPEFPGRPEPIPLSPREIPQQIAVQQSVPASLAGVLSGDRIQTTVLAGPLSPGLPLSPRPFGAGSSGSSHSMVSPRNGPHLQAAPLSPRPPRQPIPLPPGTPLASPPYTTGEPLSLKSPKPLVVKKTDAGRQPASDKTRASPTERGRVFKGFVTEEYPDLLLPPNALPSIQVKVASSRMKPSRASVLSLTQLEEDPVFTLAIFARADSAELWRVEKDLASLAKLDQKLKNCSSVTTKAPDRALFSGHAPAKLDARRIALDHYLEEILETQLDQSAALELCKYLSTNTLPPNADEVATPDIVESATTRVGPGGRPFRSGYLTKRGKNFGGWKARFFVLDGPQLKYFEAPGGAHLGTIKLPHAQIGKQSQHNENQSPATGTNTEELDNQYRHAFLVLEPKKKDSSSHVKHVLCAESDVERDQWVDALLKWIDYREPGDEEPRSGKDHTHDRHGSGGSERNMVKKKKGKPSTSNHQPSDSDNLIGVRYDSTSQGDLPHSAPGRPKTSSGLPEHPGHHEVVQPSMVISGPKDMHVISDSSMWGNKPQQALSVPSYEEKKQRKRSFFGFGPKTTRSSADGGADGLFEGSSSSTPPQGGGYQGPVRQVFGATLAEAVRYNSPVDVDVPLPAVVYRCIQYLDAKNAILEEGIFRLSGSNVVIKQIRERFNTEGDINLITDEAFYDIHAIASLLKLYLRELPTTILTRDLHNEFLSVTEMTNPKEKVMALNALVQRLPLANATLLKYLLAFLIRIINNSDVNKMTVRNVGIVFSPTLNIPAPVFAMFLQNYEPIFGIDAEEYELPSPVAPSESSRDPPPSAGLPRRPSDGQAPRPGTAEHSQSPHRQRLMEAVTGQVQSRQGSTPPPLLQDLNAARAGPNTAQNFSMHRGTNYEPQYVQQQQGSRAAYEGGMGAPQGYEAGGYSQQSRGGYPSSQMNGGYEQQQEQHRQQQQQQKANRRRESVYGGVMNPNQQGSRSGLREETRF
ncbi:hypothetical protein ACHAQA_002349 [Verticillium albo-atrum]